ncbi:hypothetical protein Tco_0326980 [Tanacetum coccineum]
MYRFDTRPTQTRALHWPQTFKNSTPHVSTSTGVNQRTSVSRPQLRNTHMKDMSASACNDSLKSRTSNVDTVCSTYGKYVFNLNHDVCVFKFINDMNDRTKKPKVVSISYRKPKRKTNQSVATSHKKTVASESTVQKSKSYFRMLSEKTSKRYTWWIEKQCPSGYKWIPKVKKKWVPKIRKDNASTSISFTIDIGSRITNGSSPTNDLGSNLSNVPSFSNSLADCSTRPIHFSLWMHEAHNGKPQVAMYEDLVQGNITMKRVYYIEGLNHNLFSVGQFCDADLEIALRKSMCFVRDLQGNDLLTGNHGSDLYTISLQ